MTNLVFYVNWGQHPSEPIIMDCSSPFGATRAYETLFSNTGIHNDYRAHTITLDMYTKGLYLLGFDLTPDREADEEHISLPVKEMCAFRHGFKSHYQYLSRAFCMLNSLDTLKLTTRGTLL
jgi:hypothetical protein